MILAKSRPEIRTIQKGNEREVRSRGGEYSEKGKPYPIGGKLAVREAQRSSSELDDDQENDRVRV